MKTVSAHELKVGNLIRWRGREGEFTRKVYDIEVDKRFARAEGGERQMYRILFERNDKLPSNLPARAEYPASTPIVTVSEQEGALLDLLQTGMPLLDSVTRLQQIVDIIEAVEQRCSAVDGPVPPTLQVMHESELLKIYRLAKGER